MNTNYIHFKFIDSVIIWLAISMAPSYAQSFWNDLNISVEFAAAQHDKRFVSPRILEQQPEKWGTWQYGISIRRSLLEWNAFNLEAGLGYSLEHLTFYRSVDICFGSDICYDILVHNDNYKIHLAQIPIRASSGFIKNLEAEVTFLPQFDIYKKLIGRRGSIGKMTFNFYSIEINPGIKYQINRINLGMNFRLFQVKKIDLVLFDPSNEKLEDYNPLKFWFSVGYRLGNAASLR